LNRILCSTGALVGRPNGRDFRLLEQCVERLDCDGFEFMMYDSWYGQVEEVRAFMTRLPAPVPAVHCEKGIGEIISRNEPGGMEDALRRFRINCELACAIGAETLVMHLWNGVYSDKNIECNLEMYGRLRKIADGYGIVLTVENVVCSHQNPLTHMRSLMKRYPDVRFTFDTKMAEFHGQMGELYTESGKGLFRHVRHMHINDFKGACMDWGSLRTLHVGQGQIDFERLFAFVKEQGYAGDFTVEATSFGTDGVIDFDALNRDFTRIREYLR